MNYLIQQRMWQKGRKMNHLKKYIFNILISLDQLVNVLLLGDPDETISSRLGKWLADGKGTWRGLVAHPICQFLRLFDHNHCMKSVESDEGNDALIRGLK